jgi:hypothetical protein
MEPMGDGDHTYKIAKAIADIWVALGIAHVKTIPKEYNLNWIKLSRKLTQKLTRTEILF